MKIIIEWFLLDNALMNACIFLLAAAFSGARIRVLPICLFSIGGAVYALLALFYIPVLRSTWVKLLSFLLLALPMWEKGTSIFWTLLSVLLSAAMLGGAVLCITLLSGGTVHADGTIVGTIPLRVSLLGLFVALLLPRWMRGLLHRRRVQSLQTTLTIRLSDGEHTLRAMIDTGNLLTEPISGLPVVLLQDVSVKTERVIPFAMQNGVGVLPAERAQEARLPEYGNGLIDCYAASAVQPILHADAILPATLLPPDWRESNETNQTATQSVFSALARLAAKAAAATSAAARRAKRRMVHPFDRNAARAARSGGGSGMHPTCSDREMGEGQTDRS